MKALVLGGGSIKGAWQAGAIKAVFEKGYKPEFISGISVGSMNGAYIVNEEGKKGGSNYESFGRNLWYFWTHNIREPRSIAIKRSMVSTVWKIIRKKFNGFADTSPLRKLIENNIDIDNLRRSNIEFQVGCVNISDGTIVYADPSYHSFKKYIQASTAIPFAMPIEVIGGQPYLDGGLKDSAPLKTAIDKGATEIVCIANHPKEMKGVSLNYGNLMELGDRVSDIVSNNNLNNDIEQAELINKLLAQGSKNSYLHGKKEIKLTIIRPEAPISVKLDDFGIKDIVNMLKSGYDTAMNIYGIN